MKDIQLRRLDLNLLLIFASITRHGKFSRAADELGLTNSAVSHAVSRLRAIFGDELFVRRQTGVDMTARALALAPKIAAIIAMTSEVLEIEREFDPNTDQRTFRLGTVDYGLALFTPSLMGMIRREAPHVRLSISSMQRAELLHNIASYKLDLAIGSFSDNLGNLSRDHLYEERFAVVSCKNHPLVRAHLTPKAYLSAGHISVRGERDGPIFLDSYFNQSDVLRDVVLTTPNYFSGLATVATSDLLMTVPEALAETYSQQFELEVHAFPFPAPSRTVSLICHPSKQHDSGVAWLRSKLFDIVKSFPGVLSERNC